ncbi:hypothetical protein ACIBK9_47455 [Nonomuraea sp. NPDC050227]|uniref:hypothetical protein n=1 Tax=Nonomuraea sp. NPDC050227 TaxID=3364360 RepID=UPI003793472C
MSDFEIRFEDPPRSTRRWAKALPFDYEQVAVTLCARPGEWAFIGATATPTRAGGVAQRIRDGVVEALAAHGEFDAVSRTVDGEYRVYARFLGEAGEVAS